jgi:hypothetical protein
MSRIEKFVTNRVFFLDPFVAQYKVWRFEKTIIGLSGCGYLLQKGHNTKLIERAPVLVQGRRAGIGKVFLNQVTDHGERRKRYCEWHLLFS